MSNFSKDDINRIADQDSDNVNYMVLQIVIILYDYVIHAHNYIDFDCFTTLINRFIACDDDGMEFIYYDFIKNLYYKISIESIDIKDMIPVNETIDYLPFKPNGYRVIGNTILGFHGPIDIDNVTITMIKSGQRTAYKKYNNKWLSNMVLNIPDDKINICNHRQLTKLDYCNVLNIVYNLDIISRFITFVKLNDPKVTMNKDGYINIDGGDIISMNLLINQIYYSLADSMSYMYGDDVVRIVSTKPYIHFNLNKKSVYDSMLVDINGEIPTVLSDCIFTAEYQKQ